MHARKLNKISSGKIEVLKLTVTVTLVQLLYQRYLFGGFLSVLRDRFDGGGLGLSNGVELRGLFLCVTVLGPGADGFWGLIFSIFHKNLSLTYSMRSKQTSYLTA